MVETNTCDKCHAVFPTLELVRVTSDDFRPKKGEEVPLSLYKKYDSLCEKCYLSLIKFRCEICKRIIKDEPKTLEGLEGGTVYFHKMCLKKAQKGRVDKNLTPNLWYWILRE